MAITLVFNNSKLLMLQKSKCTSNFFVSHGNEYEKILQGKFSEDIAGVHVLPEQQNFILIVRFKLDSN